MKTELLITLIEVGNTECPNIGTISSISGDNEELTTKAIDAIQSHFDAVVAYIQIADDLSFEDVRNSTPIDATVYLQDGTNYEIEIQQTFLY